MTTKSKKKTGTRSTQPVPELQPPPSASPKSRVSVLLPVLNGLTRHAPGSLERTLTTVLNQPSVDVEVIAVNNGSTDQTSDYLHQWSERDARVICIDLEHNRGIAEAMNQAGERATGDFCMYSTARNWYEPDSLIYLARALVEHPLPVGFTSGCMQVSGQMNRYHVPPPFDFTTYTREFVANMYMFRREAFALGCRYMDYLTIPDATIPGGMWVGRHDADFCMQLLCNLKWISYPVRDHLIVHYDYTGGAGHLSAILGPYRSQLEVAFRARWGQYL